MNCSHDFFSISWLLILFVGLSLTSLKTIFQEHTEFCNYNVAIFCYKNTMYQTTLPIIAWNIFAGTSSGSSTPGNAATKITWAGSAGLASILIVFGAYTMLY